MKRIIGTPAMVRYWRDSRPLRGGRTDRPVVSNTSKLSKYHAEPNEKPMSRPMIFVGCWPRRMSAEMAAAYCGESNTTAFLKRVGLDYPKPRVSDGRRQLWLKDDLDQAILPAELAAARDVAEDL
jgi:hypothetical protein